jgi:1-deoxy-D-xylulose-5-phosphate synthase
MQGFPVVLAMDRAGIVGEDGPTHHGVFDMAFARNIPNLVLMAPSDEDELADMLATALRLDGPVAIRYPRARGTGVPLKKEPVPIPVGKGRMEVPGDDLLIVAVGSMVAPAIEASRHLAADGIAAGVLNARFVKPLDRDLILERAAAAGKVLTVEEGVLAGGFGSGVLELFSDEGLDGLKTARMGIPDTFVEHGTRSELMTDLGLTSEGIAARGRALVNGQAAAKPRRVSYIRGVTH